MLRILRLLGILLVAAALWLGWALVLPLAPPEPRDLLFPAGTSTRSMAAQLESAGVLRSRLAFELVHALLPGRKLKPGEYLFQRAAGGYQVFERIARGDAVYRTVVIPEGYNIFEIASAIEGAGLGKKEDFLAVATTDTALVRSIDPQAHSLEGYLFPATYQFSRILSMREMAAAMVHRFQREAQSLGLGSPGEGSQGEDSHGIDSKVEGSQGQGSEMHRIVTLASIVEKETAVAAERAQVASVYDNRLAQHMPLGADPTVAYAAMLRGDYRGSIYQTDLQSDSPYNTYKFAGLPPGPVSNPGDASLRAALGPAQTHYLYFVAAGDGSGSHHFSATYEEHERNVAAYRKAQRSR